MVCVVVCFLAKYCIPTGIVPCAVVRTAYSCMVNVNFCIPFSGSEQTSTCIMQVCSACLTGTGKSFPPSSATATQMTYTLYLLKTVYFSSSPAHITTCVLHITIIIYRALGTLVFSCFNSIAFFVMIKQ